MADILVFEPNLQFAEKICRLLEQNHHTYYVALTPVELLAALMAFTPDVVLMRISREVPYAIQRRKIPVIHYNNKNIVRSELLMHIDIILESNDSGII